MRALGPLPLAAATKQRGAVFSTYGRYFVQAGGKGLRAYADGFLGSGSVETKIDLALLGVGCGGGCRSRRGTSP